MCRCSGCQKERVGVHAGNGAFCKCRYFLEVQTVSTDIRSFSITMKFGPVGDDFVWSLTGSMALETTVGENSGGARQCCLRNEWSLVWGPWFKGLVSMLASYWYGSIGCGF